MPALVAHFVFGQQVLHRLDSEIKHIILNNKPLFGLATQGPDLLFHYNAFKSNTVTDLGIQIHRRPAKDFFTKALDGGRAKNPKMLAYLLGACTHYVLDATCHPYIDACSGDDSLRHTELESDIDLAMIQRYNLDSRREIYLSREADMNVVADVYGLSPVAVKTCLFNFRMNSVLLNKLDMVRFVENTLGKPGKWSSFSLKESITFRHEVDNIFRLTEQAVEPAAELLTEFFYAVAEEKGLPAGFERNYNGESCSEL